MENISSSLGKDFMMNTISPQFDGLNGAKGNADQNDDAASGLINNFGAMLKNNMSELNALNQNSAKAVEAYAAGAPIEIHQVMLAMEKSSTAMSLAIQVKNKIVSGYQEIMRMQV